MLHDFLFDIGNVILKFDFSIGVKRIQDRCSKVSPDEILSSIADLTHEMEAGRIDTPTYVQTASERLGFSGSEGDFIRAFEDIFTLNSDMEDLIHQLNKNGHRLYLLSNTNGIHVPFFTREYPVFTHFLGAVYSHEAGVMKPEAAIYEVAIEQFELKPENTIYIDDSDVNVIAGRDTGLKGIQYDYDQHHRLLDELSELKVQLND